MILKNAGLDDAELFRMICTKSRAGAEALYDRYAVALLLCIIRIVPENEIAEDILQDTFLKIWSTIDCYSIKKEKLFTWMIAIARNLAKNKQNAILPRTMFASIKWQSKPSYGSILTLSADYGNQCIPLHPTKALFRSGSANSG